MSQAASIPVTRRTTLGYQVYDLAQIAHKPLSAEEMARFMQRNVKILQLLTKEK